MYLRGLGLGMIVTAIVLSFGVKSENKTMTDAEVRARAKELGMVEESKTLKDTADELGEVEETEPDVAGEETEPDAQAEETEPDAQADGVDKSEETTEEETTEEDKPKEVKEDTSEPETVTEEPNAESDSEEKAFEDESEEKVFEDESLDTGALKPYNLTVERGYSSDRVAGILEDAGVIDNAAAFDRYLCSNGYDKRISVGSYQIPAGADYSTVAKLITNSN